ncbi:non-specific lipid transfer protein GPI-anchored 14 [Malania oleifera]|uniref:non-specific lipid transfer protein GPI-anchored 14 n=1 Tax=Malania oleifera TaxID=397392 RepID=UPI0025AE6DFF|nr:non-specific lipid transfer protein GPI-anchored 14 [Malania oleifera]
MDTRNSNMTLRLSCSCLVFILLIGFASSDLAQDRTECADQLIGLAGCLPFVSGEAKTPTLDCCSGLKQVLLKSKKCLCILVKDRNDPNLGLKINATLALSLPSDCKAPANISECPALLHLAPNSPDAKVFEEFANSTKGSNSAPSTSAKGSSNSTGSSAQLQSDGGKAKRWLAVEIVSGVLLWCLSSHLVFTV